MNIIPREDDFQNISPHSDGEWLLHLVEQSTQTFRTLADVTGKVYFDPYKEEFHNSAEWMTRKVDEMKGEDSNISKYLGDGVLNTISWVAQAASRSWQGETSQTTIKALNDVRDNLSANLDAVIDLAPELETNEVIKIRDKIETLSQQILEASNDKKGMEKLKQIYPDNPSVVQAIEELKNDSLEKIRETLTALDFKIKERNLAVSEGTSDTETKTVLQASSILSGSQKMDQNEVFSTEPENNGTSESVEKEEPLDVSEKVREEIQEKVREDVQEGDVNVSTIIGERRPQTISRSALNTLKKYELNDVKFVDALESLNLDQVAAMMIYTKGVWLQKLHKGKPTKEFRQAEAIVGEININGTSYIKLVEEMPRQKLISLKNHLINYWYTYRVNK